MATKGGKAYLGLDYTISLILAIIPFTSWLLGIITCIQRGKLLWAIIRIFCGWNIIWILDIITMILHKDITILA